MRDFEGFYQKLPDLLKGNLVLTFAPVLQNLHPKPDDEWVVILDEEMLALVEHPDIQWNQVKTYNNPFSQSPQHPLHELFMKMSLYQPMPFNADIAQALSQRLSAEEAALFFAQSPGIAGCYPQSYADRNILVSRYASYVLLIPGVLDQMVDLYFKSIKGNESLASYAPTIYEHAVTAQYLALPDDYAALPFGLITLLTALCALDPQTIKASINRYMPDLSPVQWVNDFMATQFHPNAQTTENAMRYVLHHAPAAYQISDFIAHALPKTDEGKPDYQALSLPMCATLMVNLLRFELIDEMEDLHAGHRFSDKHFYRALIDEATHLYWDAIGLIDDFFDEHSIKKGLFDHFAQDHELSSLLHDYTAREYLPQGTSVTCSHLIRKHPNQAHAQNILAWGASHAKCASPIGVYELRALIRIYRDAEYMPKVIQEALGGVKQIMKRIYHQVTDSPGFNEYAAVTLVEELLRSKIYSPAQVYGSIPSIKCLNRLRLNDEQRLEAIQHASPRLKRELLEADISP
jgi:hypothetical protein